MNAIVIEQSHETAKLAFELHRNVELKAIRLTDSKLSSTRFIQAPAGAIGIAIDFESKQLTAPAGAISLQVGFKMAGTESPDEPEATRNEEPMVTVSCSYDVEYVVREGFQPSKAQIDAFREGNAIFNVWPYFREYLQSSLQRMGFPPFVAPFLKIEPQRKAPKRSEGGQGE